MNTTWITVITGTGILFGLLVSLHFLTVKRPGIAIRWLGAFTLSLAIGLSEYLFQSQPTVLTILGAASLLYGPFLYLYVKSRLLQADRFNAGVLRHFIFFALYVALIAVSLSSPAPETGAEADGLVELILYELLFVQIFVYCFRASSFIRKNKEKLPVHDPEIGRMQIAFMQILVTLSAILFFASFAATHFFLLSGVSVSFGFKFFVQVAMCILIFVIALLNTETMYAKKLVKVY